MDVHEARRMRKRMQQGTMENICFVRDSLLQPNYHSCNFRFYPYTNMCYIPNYQPSDLTIAPPQPVDASGIDQPTSSLPYHSAEGQPPQQEHQQLLEDFTADGPEHQSFYAKPQIPSMSAHDLYVEQKAEQVAQVLQFQLIYIKKI